MSNEACGRVRDHLFRLGAAGRGANPPDCIHLDNLTSKGTRETEYTNNSDWAGLHAQGTEEPKKTIPGLQIEGYFLDEPSSTTLTPGNAYGKRDKNGNKVYPYDSQFVIRFPDSEHWKGRLVITGSPGVRGQYANDIIISDHVLDKGCAFASTDKGNSGLRFYIADQGPGDAMAEWHRRIKQLAQVVKEAAKEYYGHFGKELKYTYVTGCSNGGYLTRYALENDHDDLYDGGVDWQGTLFTDPDSTDSDPEDRDPNLLTFLPQALKHYVSSLRDARNAMTKAGFEPDQGFLWEYYYTVYWNLVQRIYREEFDPYYIGADADYNYAERINPSPQAPELVQKQAQAIKAAVKRVSLTGDIKKRLITLHGTLDALFPITKSADKYAELVKQAGRSKMHRCYRIEGGTHVDSLYDYPRNIDPTKDQDPLFREKLRPMLPCYKAAFDMLVEWVECELSPPDNRTVPKPEGDVVNSCSELGKQE